MTTTQTPAAGMSPLPAAGSNRPVPPHGTPARYQGNRSGTRPPCKCRPCVDAHTKACQRRELAHLNGVPPRVPSGPVTAHIRGLLAAGMSRTQIALAAGVSRSSVAHIALEKNPAVNRTTADKILAVRPRIVRDTDLIPVTGTRRRVQALYAIGHGSVAIVAATGLTHATVQNLLYRTEVTTAGTYKAVRAAYRQLATKPGNSRRAKASARAGGWPPPAAWDDDIDNPAAVPDRGEEVARYAAIAEDATWLIETQGYTRRDAAARLGISLDYLVRALGYARQKEAA